MINSEQLTVCELRGWLLPESATTGQQVNTWCHSLPDAVIDHIWRHGLEELSEHYLLEHKMGYRPLIRSEIVNMIAYLTFNPETKSVTRATIKQALSSYEP